MLDAAWSVTSSSVTIPPFYPLTICFPFLQPSDIIRTTHPACGSSTIFHFPSDHFPLPIPHISSLLPLFIPPSLPPSACSFLGPCAGGAITEGGIDSFALMWFGLRRDTAHSHTFSRRTESSSLSACTSCVFKQANQHHSARLASLSSSLCLPPSRSVKSHQPFLQTHRSLFFSTFAAFIRSTLPFMEALLIKSPVFLCSSVL